MALRSKIRQLDPYFILILTLAAALRLIRPGLLPTWIDELNIMDAAIRLAQHGEMIWVGNESSFGLLQAHSPLATYTTALAAAIYPHPLFLRIVFGLLGVLAVAISYIMLRKWVGPTAARVAALMLAVMPLPIYWSRFVWNPNLTPLLLMLWLYTAIEGYIEGRKRLQWLHWLSLSLVIQSQAAMLVIAPLSAGLALIAIWRAHRQRLRALLRHFAMGVLVLVTFTPWIIGLIGLNQGRWATQISAGNFDSGTIAITPPTPDELQYTLGLLISSANYNAATLRMSDTPASWWFPEALHMLLTLQALVTLIGGLVLASRHLYTAHRQAALSLFLTVAMLWSSLMLAFDRVTSDFYMMLTTFAATLVFAWLMQILAGFTRWLMLVPALFIGLQLWLSLSILDYNLRDPNVQSYGEIITSAQRWTDSGVTDALIIEANAALNRVQQAERRSNWRILSETLPIRYTNDARTIPIAPDGQRIVTDSPSTWLDEWGQATQAEAQPAHSFRSLSLSFEDFPQANYTPQTDTQFSDLATVTGIYAPQAPAVNSPWYFFVYWQPQQMIAQTLQYSVRLVDDSGQRYAQIDQPSLQPDLWRVGDTVVTLFAMPIGDALPQNPLIELVMYTLPEQTVIPVVDESGQPIAQAMQLR